MQKIEKITGGIVYPSQTNALIENTEELDKRVIENKEKISGNKESIDTLADAVDANKETFDAEVLLLDKKIDTNTTDINNKIDADIATLDNKIDSNTTELNNSINNNTADILSNKESIDTLSETLVSNKEELENNISTLDTKVVKNTNDISSNKNSIDTLSETLVLNKEELENNISTLDTKVVKNTNDISSNKNSIDTLSETLVSNKEELENNISTLDTKVVKNTNDISSNYTSLNDKIDNLELTGGSGGELFYSLPEDILYLRKDSTQEDAINAFGGIEGCKNLLEAIYNKKIITLYESHGTSATVSAFRLYDVTILTTIIATTFKVWGFVHSDVSDEIEILADEINLASSEEIVELDDRKQDKLITGTGIGLENNTIYAAYDYLDYIQKDWLTRAGGLYTIRQGIFVMLYVSLITRSNLNAGSVYQLLDDKLAVIPFYEVSTVCVINDTDTAKLYITSEGYLRIRPSVNVAAGKYIQGSLMYKATGYDK